MKIVIIGFGVVGQATKETLKGNNTIEIHDPKKGHISNYKDADVVFICTPHEHVGSYLNELKDHESVFVRSTIQFEWVLNTNIAVWPEFLTERTWKEDAVNPLCCICGGSIRQLETLKNLTKFKYIKSWYHTENHTAALMKNATNVFYTMKVSYANILYDICEKYNISYDKLKNCITEDPRMGTQHWDVPGPDGKLGYGGKCFPQNLEMMRDLIKDNDLLIEIERYNNSRR